VDWRSTRPGNRIHVMTAANPDTAPVVANGSFQALAADGRRKRSGPRRVSKNRELGGCVGGLARVRRNRRGPGKPGSPRALPRLRRRPACLRQACGDRAVHGSGKQLIAAAAMDGADRWLEKPKGPGRQKLAAAGSSRGLVPAPRLIRAPHRPGGRTLLRPPRGACGARRVPRIGRGRAGSVAAGIGSSPFLPLDPRRPLPRAGAATIGRSRSRQNPSNKREAVMGSAWSMVRDDVLDAIRHGRRSRKAGLAGAPALVGNSSAASTGRRKVGRVTKAPNRRARRRRASNGPQALQEIGRRASSRPLMNFRGSRKIGRNCRALRSRVCVHGLLLGFSS